MVRIIKEKVKQKEKKKSPHVPGINLDKLSPNKQKMR